MITLKTRENRVRRNAARQGTRLVKSRQRYGGYMLVDAAHNWLVAEFTELDEVDEYLAQVSR